LARSVSSFKSDENNDVLPYEYKCLFLTMPRTMLYQRIDARCEQMISDGLLQVCSYAVKCVIDCVVKQETISLVHKNGLVLDSPAGRSLGYRQVLEFLHHTWGFPPDCVPKVCK